MVCLGLEPWAAGWKAQTNPRNYGGTPLLIMFGFVINTTAYHLGRCNLYLVLLISYMTRYILKSTFQWAIEGC